MNIPDTLYDLYLRDTQPTKFWSIWVALLASIGMLLKANDPSTDINLLLHLFPWWFWSIALAYMAVSRAIAVMWWNGTVATRIFTPLLSIVVWGLFLAAQKVAPQFGLGLLFIVPAFQEVWILSRVFWDERLLWKPKH